MAVTQGPSIAHITSDPLRNFKFLVTIFPPSGAAITIGFMSVGGLTVTNSVIAYREGGMNTVTQKLPGQSDFSPIVLSRGVAVGHTEDIAWLKQIFAVTQGTVMSNGGGGVALVSGTTAGGGSNVSGVAVGNDFRRNIDISVLAHPVTSGLTPVSARFYVYNAWPTSVSYSDLDAGANQLLISQMTLAHEGWDYSLASSITGDAPAINGQ
jgi:phage tail-like protein